ncbi:TetR/AcrR family transcriptional regulator [Novosphingobium sp. AP12]|uniref:TetR/AcrR family transcriptional regulator n=1 Tax=Novosphingobium sp. AP12 TaxID=1144305 RepID=UPI0002720FCD|nr:TetR/AcrR family transcriptional regulator [Novosphingobium sp. AP12]EJL30457.1 transcriptional regulator [Novosphingobium sp. AP12]
MSSREAILAAAKQTAQSRGYAGINFRELAEEVGIKHASIYHHFPSKADLAVAVARRYWENAAANLSAMSERESDPAALLSAFPGTFRQSLENDNRLCLGSFMAAEYDDLPDAVKVEVQAFADVNVAWLAKTLADAKRCSPEKCEAKARAIFAATAGAQLMARSRADITLFDTLIDTYRTSGLLEP